MPRYFFHVRDQRSAPDSTGTVLDNLREAQCAATQLAGELLCERKEELWTGRGWAIEIADGSGIVLSDVQILRRGRGRAIS